MSWTCRPFNPGDRRACLTVLASNVPRFFHAGEVRDFNAFLDQHGDRYWVVLEGDDIVGCGGFALSEDGQLASLCWGMVRRDRHGQRIGTQLLRARLDAIAATTATTVRLSTSQLTQGFYQGQGFEVFMMRRDGIAPGLDEVEMRLTPVPAAIHPSTR